MGHFGPRFINPAVSIGNNCYIGQGVTIGVEYRGQRCGSPTIGNKVWIGANSVIVGKISIGDNVLIAPGSFINFDVPDNSIVCTNTGKIIKHSYSAVDKYIDFETCL